MQVALVARDERLHEVRAVGVPVEVDLAQPERPQDRGEVARGVDGREQVGGVKGGPPGPAVAALDLAGARRHDPRELGSRGHTPKPLDRPAVDERRAAGAAVVHEQQSTLAQQRPVDPHVLVAASRGRVAGTALHGHERGVSGVVARRQPAEPDVDARALRSSGVEWPGQGAAPPARTVLTAVKPDRAQAQAALGGRGARRCTQENEGGNGREQCARGHRGVSLP